MNAKKKIRRWSARVKFFTVVFAPSYEICKYTYLPIHTRMCTYKYAPNDINRIRRPQRRRRCGNSRAFFNPCKSGAEWRRRVFARKKWRIIMLLFSSYTSVKMRIFAQCTCVVRVCGLGQIPSLKRGSSMKTKKITSRRVCCDCDFDWYTNNTPKNIQSK